MKKITFPPGFLWGSATSSYQVEGGIKNADWSKFKDSKQACRHYFLYNDDFALAKKLGHNAHRFSIEWSRIEPKEGRLSKKEVTHYQKMIHSLRKYKLEPFVTLFHFTLPQWLSDKGGFSNKKAPDYFKRYVEFVVKNLKGVRFWLTINEPMIYTTKGYLFGQWPPFKKGIYSFFKAVLNLVSAHKKAFSIIHQYQPSAFVGIAKNNFFFTSWLFFPMKYFWNEYFLQKIRKQIDFIGLNYYFTKRLLKNKKADLSDLGWEINPLGLYFVLMDLKKYQLPIYITENGLADAEDAKRKYFIISHIKAMHRAINNGVPLKGYFYWSLLDNFEWDYGFEARFGLIEVDFKTQKRKPRDSAFLYKEICENNEIPSLL